MPILGVAGDKLERPKKKQTAKEWRALHPNKKKKNLKVKILSPRAQRRLKKRQKLKALESKERAKYPHLKGDGRLRYFQLYALELTGGHFYVGLTAYSDVQVRYKQHESGIGGAVWTKLHPPIKVIETRKLGHIYESEASKQENAMTVEYMSKYGVEIVRGGDMCQISIKAVLGRYNEHLKNKT